MFVHFNCSANNFLLNGSKSINTPLFFFVTSWLLRALRVKISFHEEPRSIFKMGYKVGQNLASSGEMKKYFY